MTTVQEIKETYEKVVPACRAFYKSTAPLNEFWGGLNERVMRGLIEEAKSLEDLVHGAQKTFMFSVNVPDPVKARAVSWLLRERALSGRCAVLGLGLLSLSESSHSWPANNVEMDGQVFTPDFLRCVNIAAQIAKHTALFGARVVELGGGLGHLARVLRQAGISRQHVIIDLPETLAFSSAFLRLNFPDASFQAITSPDERVSETADFAFVPVAFADAALGERPDLFLNTASMGEMRNETIRHWMKFIQEKLTPRFLFMLNRFLNTTGPGLSWRAHENECQQHYDRNWSILNWEIEPAYTRCPYVDTLVSRYVEIIAKRTEVSAADAVAVAAAHEAEVADEDWWRQRAQGHVMGMRDNLLCLDGGMSGALFKLWDMLRLDPNPTRLRMLLAFLARLNRDPNHPFEEMPFYLALSQRLRSAK